MIWIILATTIIILFYLLLAGKKLLKNKNDSKKYIIDNFLTLTLSFLGILVALFVNDYHNERIERKKVCNQLEIAIKDMVFYSDMTEKFVTDLYKEGHVNDRNKRNPDILLAMNSYIAGYYAITPFPRPSLGLSICKDPSVLKYMSGELVMELYYHEINTLNIIQYLDIIKNPDDNRVNDAIEYDISDICLIDAMIAYVIDLKSLAAYCQAEYDLLKGHLSKRKYLEAIDEIEREKQKRMPKLDFIIIRVPSPAY